MRRLHEEHIYAERHTIDKLALSVACFPSAEVVHIAYDT